MCRTKNVFMTKKQMDDLYNLWVKEDKYCLLHPGMQCSIILCPDGSTYDHYDVAGGTSVPIDVWEGKDVILFTMCYQNLDVEIDFADQDFEGWLNAKGVEYDHDLDYRDLRDTMCDLYNQYREDVVDNFIYDYDTPQTLEEKLIDSPIVRP